MAIDRRSSEQIEFSLNVFIESRNLFFKNIRIPNSAKGKGESLASSCLAKSFDHNSKRVNYYDLNEVTGTCSRYRLSKAAVSPHRSSRKSKSIHVEKCKRLVLDQHCRRFYFTAVVAAGQCCPQALHHHAPTAIELRQHHNIQYCNGIESPLQTSHHSSNC